MKRILTLACLALGLVSAAPAQELKNVIVMIADGWGFNSQLAANYWNGTTQPFQQFPVQVAMSTYSWTVLQQDPAGYDAAQAWTDFYYMMLRATDSASAATAMSTGVKNRDGEINVDPVTREALLTVTERAEQLGKSTGVVTSVEWSHATPAAFAAHDISRNNFSAIAVEMLDSTGLEVIMGAGHPLYGNNGQPATPSYTYVGGQAKWNQLAGGTHPLGWTLVQTRAEFEALESGPTPARVCGTAQVRTTLQQARTPAEGGNSMTPPYTVPLNASVPTLATLTRGALNVLDDNPLGFLLMIEGGAVDWAGHANQMGRMIEEVDAFNAAVAAVIAWVEANSDWNETLLIITGDHETGYLWGPGSGAPSTWNPLVDYGPQTVPGAWFYSGSHTNSLVPFFAKGIGADWLDNQADLVDSRRGRYLDNTDIAHVIFGYFDGILAVELNFFDAVARNGAVELAWATFSETQTGHFELERDNRTIARVEARNFPTGYHYAWTDREATPGRVHNYRLVAVDLSGTREVLASKRVLFSAAGVAVIDYELHQNFPNPFNPRTTITYDLPQAGMARLTVFNVTGQIVAIPVEGWQEAGRHTATFDARGLPAGMYLGRLEAGGTTEQIKMLLLK